MPYAARSTVITPPRPPAPSASPRDIAEQVNTQLNARLVQVGDLPIVGATTISSGFPALDQATGLGGFPRGRITELIGRPTCGRETVAARTVASATGYSAWIDVPALTDVAYLAQCGIDLERLYIVQPRQPLDALAIATHLVAAQHFSVVVLDALDDLPPAGTNSQAIGRFIRVVTPALGRATTALLILSGPESPARSLAHAAALRISFLQVGLLRRGGVLRGWRTRARILKSPGLARGEPTIEIWVC